MSSIRHAATTIAATAVLALGGIALATPAAADDGPDDDIIINENLGIVVPINVNEGALLQNVEVLNKISEVLKNVAASITGIGAATSLTQPVSSLGGLG